MKKKVLVVLLSFLTAMWVLCSGYGSWQEQLKAIGEISTAEKVKKQEMPPAGEGNTTDIIESITDNSNTTTSGSINVVKNGEGTPKNDENTIDSNLIITGSDEKNSEN